MDGAEGVIEQLLPVDGERPERFVDGVVTGVGLGDGEAGLDRRIASVDAPWRRKRLARIPAVPEHVNPIVPGRGEAQFEAHFRQNLSGYVAILRQVAESRNQRGRLDRKLIAGQAHERAAIPLRLNRGAVIERRLPVPELIAVLRQRRRGRRKKEQKQEDGKTPVHLAPPSFNCFGPMLRM